MSPNNNALAVAEKLTLAFAARDLAHYSQLYADDVVIWHSHNQIEQNKQENIALMEFIFTTLSDTRYDSIVRQVTEMGFVQQHFVRGCFADDSELTPIPVCMVVEVRNGLIARIDEYGNPPS